MDIFPHPNRKRRAVLQDWADEERARPAPDSLRLGALNKLQPHLRERIEISRIG